MGNKRKRKKKKKNEITYHNKDKKARALRFQNRIKFIS